MVVFLDNCQAQHVSKFLVHFPSLVGLIYFPFVRVDGNDPYNEYPRSRTEVRDEI